MLNIKDLSVTTDGKKILKKVNLKIKPGEVHVLMGPNGSGKSTLSKALMGHPHFQITKGQITINKKNITKLAPDERSKAGLYLAFQYPIEVPGVNLANFLRLAYNSGKSKKDQLSVFKFRKFLRKKLELLNMSEDFLERNLNEGFSGGEKKKTEILQMAVLEPKYAILDETDSGLDVDALRDVFEGLTKLKTQNPKLGTLIITHYQRIFDYIEPDFVHILKGGRITKSGGLEVAEAIEKKGYN